MNPRPLPFGQGFGFGGPPVKESPDAARRPNQLPPEGDRRGKLAAPDHATGRPLATSEGFGQGGEVKHNPVLEFNQTAARGGVADFYHVRAAAVKVRGLAADRVSVNRFSTFHFHLPALRLGRLGDRPRKTGPPPAWPMMIERSALSQRPNL
jgi:hypothetical protein